MSALELRVRLERPGFLLDVDIAVPALTSVGPPAPGTRASRYACLWK